MAPRCRGVVLLWEPPERYARHDMTDNVADLFARHRAVIAGLVLSITAAACASTTSGGPETLPPPAPVPANITPAAPKALFATAADGTRIVYDVTGTGPALVLVHGGGQTRESWK